MFDKSFPNDTTTTLHYIYTMIMPIVKGVNTGYIWSLDPKDGNRSISIR